jgi:hypothetical protein
MEMELITKIALIITAILILLFFVGCTEKPKNGWFVKE